MPALPDFATIYRDRFIALTTEHTHASTRARHHRLLFFAAAALTALLTLLALRGTLPARLILLPVVAVLLTLPPYLRLRSHLDRLDRLLALYRCAIARSSGLQPQSGHTGDDLDIAREPHHLYRHDLQILGPDSLFGLLATTRTRLGRETLARTLLHLPRHPDEIRARQLALQELAPQTALRESIALLGDQPAHEIPSIEIHAWLAQPIAAIPPSTRPLLLLTSSLAVLLLLAGAFHLAPWSTLRPNLAAVLALQIALALRVRAKITPILAAAKHLPRQIALLSEGIALIERTPVHAPALLQLRNQVATAAPTLAPLNRTLALLEQRNNQYFFLPALLLALGTHGAIDLDRWRTRHAPDLRRCLDAFAEFEALNALATYAFEHPANTYPEILPDGTPASFHATALRHPLLPATTAVPNDIRLDPDTRFYLISGSNMAGKSTLLRAIGAATVLALAGAPIPATSARLSAFTLCASISLTDSLADGKSKFLAEVERLHAILQATTHPHPNPVISTEGAPGSPGSVLSSLGWKPGSPASVLSSSESKAAEDKAASPQPHPLTSTSWLSSRSEAEGSASPTQTTHPVLFLIDEIFSGTNSADRLTAAAAVLRRLIANGALGALSTHDLALTTLAEPTPKPTQPDPTQPDPAQPDLHGLNLHMASPDPEDPLAFDYLLKPGINRSTNALAILRLIGIQP